MTEERQAESGRIKEMFSAIVPRYDLLNHLLSLGADVRWRRWLVTQAQVPHRGLILDLCCGTGDLTLALVAGFPSAYVVGVDFSREMIRAARAKADGMCQSAIDWVCADALTLPWPENTFHLATAAFGIRNFVDLHLGLGEALRVLRPGGKALFLEFHPPPKQPASAPLRFYFHQVLPRLGDWISGRQGAYQYLRDSVSSFPDAACLDAAMAKAGFVHVWHKSRALGLVGLHHGVKPR